MDRKFWRTVSALLKITSPMIVALLRLEADSLNVSQVVPVLKIAQNYVMDACPIEAWVEPLGDILAHHFTFYHMPVLVLLFWYTTVLAMILVALRIRVQATAWFLDPTHRIVEELELESVAYQVELILST